MAKQPKRIPPFNPLDKTNLGESVAEAMLQQLSFLRMNGRFLITTGLFPAMGNSLPA